MGHMSHVPHDIPPILGMSCGILGMSWGTFGVYVVGVCRGDQRVCMSWGYVVYHISYVVESVCRGERMSWWYVVEHISYVVESISRVCMSWEHWSVCRAQVNPRERWKNFSDYLDLI